MNVPPDLLYAARFARPDLLVPGEPGSGWSRRLIGLHEPRFGEVSRRIDRLVLLGALGTLAGELLADVTARLFILALVAVIGGYALVSAVCLTVLRRRQNSFESVWLVEQSKVLRGRRFDVLRFTTSEPVQTHEGRQAARRVYDLTRPEEVDRLLELRHRADIDGVTVPVTVEFSYSVGDGMGLEEVRSELSSIRFVPGSGAGAAARVSFPVARYRVLASRDRPMTYWVLGLPCLTVTRQSPGRSSLV